MPDSNGGPNAAALAKAITAIGKKSLIFGLLMFLAVWVIGTLGGTAEAAGATLQIGDP